MNTTKRRDADAPAVTGEGTDGDTPSAQQLWDAWERQEAVSRQVNLLLFTLDAEGIVTYLGGRALSVFDPAGEHRCKDFREVFRDAPDMMRRIELARQGRGGTWHVEMNNRVWEVRLTPRADSDGRVVRVHAAAEDITQRHEQENRMRWKEREMAALHALAGEIGSTLEFEEVVRMLGRQMDQLLNIPGGALYLLDFRTFEVEPHAVWNLSRPLSERIERYVMERFAAPPESDREDTAFAPHFLPRELLGDEADAGIRFSSGYVVPLISREMLLGLLVLLSPDEHAFYRHRRPFYEMLGRQVGTALQNARLHRRLWENREQLQHLARRLVDAQENERSRVARELHDELGQMLTCLKISLELADRPETTAENAARHRAEARETVAELIDHVRQMSLRLRPTVLDDVGLLPTLLWHTERFRSQTNITVHLSHSGIEGRRFPMRLETAAYRIVQEALTNIARHAGTEEAWVDLRTVGDERSGVLDILIEDAGAGFDPSAFHLSSGLSGMRERAVAVGGTLQVTSGPEAGTRIEARLPLGPAEEGVRSHLSDFGDPVD